MLKNYDIERTDIKFISERDEEYDISIYRKFCEIWNDFEPEDITDSFILLHNKTTKILNKLTEARFGRINGLTIIIPFYITKYKPYLLKSSILDRYIDKLIQIFIKYNKDNIFL